jgi:hypothetical protein
MKKLFLLVLLISQASGAMERLKALTDRYPKTSGFVAGTVVTAGLLEAYHLWKHKDDGVRDLIGVCTHIPRAKPNGELVYREYTEYHEAFLDYVHSIYYKNPLSGTTEIYEEDRKDIRIELTKLSREYPGSPETEVSQSGGTLSLVFRHNNWTMFDIVNCKILLPRNQKLIIKILGADTGPSYNKEAVLYQKH